MENTASMPAAALPMESTTPAVVTKKKEHLMVEVVGGITVATTIVSALSLWYVFLAYVLPVSA